VSTGYLFALKFIIEPVNDHRLMDAINKLIISESVAAQSIQKTRPSKKAENSVLIPIKVDFLFVKAGDPPLAEAKVNFEKLPFNNGHEDVNSEFAYVSENFLSQPFQNANLVLPPGLHMHWALPDAFTKGKVEGNENEKQVTHHKVPDRWIINRKRNDTIERSWIVESNYLRPEGKSNKYHAIAYPLKVTNAGQPFRYMGRSYLFHTNGDSYNISEVIKEAGKSQYFNNLTVAGYGEHSFAAFYPNCHSVFGFCDKEIKEQTELNGIEYELLGWYSDPYADPLKERCNALNFDGVDDYIALPDRVKITGKKFTLEAFIYPTTTTDGISRLIVGYPTPVGNTRPPSLYIYNGTCLQGGFGDGLEWYSFISDPVLNLNSWNHVAMSYDGTTLYGFINGVKIYSTTAFANKTPNKQIISVIGKSDGSSGFFGGHIKDLRIWDKYRSVEEVRLGMNYEFDMNEPGLIGYYKFKQGFDKEDNHETTMLFDSSAQQNHGELIGFDLTGSSSNWLNDMADHKPRSKALKFNGINNSIIVTDNSSIQLTAYTAELWIKPNGQPNEEWKGILGKPGRNFNIWLHQNGLIHHRFHTTTNKNEGVPDTQAGAIRWNEWNHVAITNDGTKATTYINGKVEATGPVNGNLIIDNTSLLIGCNLDGDPGNFFNGEIAEIRIWNIARTIEEIQSSMNLELDEPRLNLAAYYKFGQDLVSASNTGIIELRDSSGKNNSAKLNFNLFELGINWMENDSQFIQGSGALAFDGSNEYLSSANDLHLTMNAYTAELWIKPFGQPDEFYKSIFYIPGRTFSIFLEQDGSIHHIYYVDGPKNMIHNKTNSSSITFNEWNHVAITNDGVVATTYINGELKETRPVGSVLAVADESPIEPLIIAFNSFSIGGIKDELLELCFKGQVSEFRLWNIARSETEIRTSMKTEFIDPQNGLQVYYKFDQPVSAINKNIQDRSGNDHHAIFNTASISGLTEAPLIFYLPKKIKRLFNFNLTTISNSITEAPLRTLCYATLSFDQARGLPFETTDPVSIAIGNYGMEALAALLNNEHKLTNSDGEDRINALSLMPGIAHGRLDIDAILEEKFHEKSFSPVPGGHIWRLFIESVINKNDNSKKDGADISLPDTFAFLINDLNQLQQYGDRLKDELISLRHQLYVDWCKYMASSYHPDIEKGLPRSDDIRYFIEKQLQREIEAKKKQIKDNNSDKDQILYELHSLIASFNFSNKYGDIILNIDGSINEAQSNIFLKLFAEKKYSSASSNVITDNALENVYVKNFSGVNEGWESETEIGSINKFKAISFWATISSHQPSDEASLIILNGIKTPANITTKIDSDTIGTFWRSIYINGKMNNAFEKIKWEDIPTDQWTHIYLEGDFVVNDPITISLLKNLKGSIAGVRLFTDALSETELFCDINMLLLKKLTLTSEKGPRFWQPNEPVILISGNVAKPSERYGFDDELSCLLMKTEIEPIDISYDNFDLNDDLPAFITKLVSLKNLLSQIKNTALTYPGFKNKAQNSSLYKRPWNPLFLEWKVGVIPLDDDSTTSEYKIPEDLVTKSFMMASDQPDLLRKNDTKKGSDKDAIKVFTGTSILTPHAKESLMEVIEKYLESLNQDDDDWKDFNKVYADEFNPFYKAGEIDSTKMRNFAFHPTDNFSNNISTALKVYQELYKGNFLSQSLSGFNAAMQMLHQAFQLPIADPLGFNDEQKFTADVKVDVQRESKFAPLPLFDFDPVRTGDLQLLELNIIDAFGQVQKIYDTGILMPHVYFSKRMNNGEILPRISQPARINFRWLSANSDSIEMNDHPVSSPVCGWLLVNNLENNIMVYDDDGNVLGSVGAVDDDTPTAKWQNAPGTDHITSFEQIQNSHLKDVIDRLLQTPNVPAFIQLLERTMDQIDPENFSNHTELALLIGKPIAIVRASVGLEAKGNFAVNQDWTSFQADMNKAVNNTDLFIDRTTNGWEKIKFPVRIGEHGQMNDGVVGYWLDSSTDVFHTPVSSNDTSIIAFTGINTNSRSYDKYSPSIKLSLSDTPETMTMLIDPRGIAHAACGVLPAKTISLPDDQFKPSLKKMSMTFFTRPILMPADKVAIPLPGEQGYQWSWLVKSENKWLEVSTKGITHKEIFEKNFNNGKDIWNELIKKGWIMPTINNKATVIPINQRKDPEPGNLLSEQLEKIQQILDKGHITDAMYSPDFVSISGVKEGWLKLTPEN